MPFVPTAVFATTPLFHSINPGAANSPASLSFELAYCGFPGHTDRVDCVPITLVLQHSGIPCIYPG